jgi:hypothetical protein
MRSKRYFSVEANLLRKLSCPGSTRQRPEPKNGVDAAVVFGVDSKGVLVTMDNALRRNEYPQTPAVT